MEMTLAQPVLETERLTLRPMRISDAGLISLYSSDLRVARMTTTIPHPNPPGAVEQFIARVSAPESPETTWAIDGTKGFGCEVMGVISLRQNGELGYWLAPFFWGLGIMPEAGKAVIDHAFSTGLTRVHAQHFIDNPASGRVMEKIGMRRAGSGETAFSIARNEAVAQVRYERLRDG